VKTTSYLKFTYKECSTCGGGARWFQLGLWIWAKNPIAGYAGMERFPGLDGGDEQLGSRGHRQVCVPAAQPLTNGIMLLVTWERHSVPQASPGPKGKEM
jgi:hypothetical protein